MLRKDWQDFGRGCCSVASPFRVLLSASAVFLLGCATIEVPTTHIVMANGLGNPVDPTGNYNGKHVPWFSYPKMDPNQYDEYLNDMMQALNEYKSKHSKARILIFVHGGLNTAQTSISRAAMLTDHIMKGPPDKDGYFPIFINWDSSLLSSYFVDHLFNIRQGEHVNAWCCNKSPPTPQAAIKTFWSWFIEAPIYLLTDLVRSIARAPVVATFELWNGVKSLPFVELEDRSDVSRIAKELEKNATEPNIIKFARGKDTIKNEEHFTSVVSWFINIPFKLVSTPLIDATGKSSWEIMLRRTGELFHIDDEFDTSSPMGEKAERDGKLRDIKPSGNLSIFLKRLKDQHMADLKNNGQEPWEITLISHSMGSIVLNEMIRRSGDLPIANIVYMAAACSVKDYEDTVFPYMERKKKVKVYHLMLSERAEALERWRPSFLNLPPGFPLEIAPRGSLLVWVDELLTNPLTPRDRTLGRYTNLMVSLHDIPENLRNRVNVKVFAAGADSAETNPQKHSDFTEKLRFWDPDCWTPSTSNLPTCYNEKGWARKEAASIP